METTVFLLIALICICWIGFGWVSALIMETEGSEDSKKIKVSVGIRIILIFFWPIAAFFYLFKGMN